MQAIRQYLNIKGFLCKIGDIMPRALDTYCLWQRAESEADGDGRQPVAARFSPLTVLCPAMPMPRFFALLKPSLDVS
jgi:hypothetical protein